MDLRKEFKSFKSKFKNKTNQMSGSQGKSGSPVSQTAPPIASPGPSTLTAQSTSGLNSPPEPTSGLPSGVPPTSDPAWAPLKRFLRILDAQAIVFGPVKTVVEDLFQVISMSEDTMIVRRDYAVLKSHLEKLFEDLCVLFSGNTPPTMSTSIRNLCNAIEGELNLMCSESDKQTWRRHLDAEKDIESIMDCYRRIGAHLDQFKASPINAINTWKFVDGIAVEARLKSLNPSTAAFYNSTEADTVHRRECTPKTREQVLDDLGRWRHDPQQSNMYWMNGMAGTGKTTITNSLCALLDRSHELGASFFCTRQLPECRNVKLVVPTIAYQLARFSYPFRCALSRVLEQDPDIHNRALPKQFEDMIIRPLREVASTLPANLVIVIDALDECDDANGVGLLLELFAQRITDLPLKLFVSSRPEPQIRRKLGSTKSQLILHELEESIVTEDIATYLRVELGRMSISDSQITALVERAGVLFIYAATVVRYIGAKNFTLNPRQRLATVLDTSGAASSNKHREIDALYSAVLDAAFNDPDLESSDKEIMKLVLNTMICVQEPLTVDALTGLLQLDDESLVIAALQPLWSVLHVSGTKNLVTTLHTSFPDYMLDAGRSKEYECKANHHHTRLAEFCFVRIKHNECQFNICHLESSYLVDELVPDIEERVERYIPLDLAYACQYWGFHLRLGLPSTENIAHLEDFLSFRLLLWMEIMNLRMQMGISGPLLDKVKRWGAAVNCPQDLKDTLHDAWQFVATFATNPVSRSTPHIYISMLSSWPRSRRLAELYTPRCQYFIRLEGSGIAQRQLASMSMFIAGIYICTFAYSPDGTRIATGTFGREINLWDVQTGRLALGPLVGHEKTVYSVAFSPNSKRIASGSDDCTIRIWDTQSGLTVLGPLIGHTGTVLSLAFASDATRIVSSSADMAINIWDAQSGQILLGPLEGHSGPVTSVAFSPDGTRIASGSHDHTVRVWDSQSGRLALDPIQAHSHIVYTVDFSPDGKQIASGGADAIVCLWDAQTGEMVLEPFEGHTKPVTSVSFSPDGTHIASGSFDHTVRIWNIQSGKTTLGPLEGHTDRVFLVAFSPDGSQLISAADDNAVFTWDAQSEQVTVEPLEGHSALIASVEFSPDGKLIASGSYDHKIYIWDAQSGHKSLGPLTDHGYWVHSVAFSPDGTHLATGSYDSTIRIWEVQSGRTVVGPLQESDSWVQSVAYSPDGKYLASGHTDNLVRLWDIQAGQMIWEPIEGHTILVNTVAFSPKGNYIASGGMGSSVIVWNAETGQKALGPLEADIDSVTSITFSPDGTQIITGSNDTKVHVWDVESRQIVLGPLRGHDGWIHSISVSPDGKYIASGSSDKTICMWDAHGGNVVLLLGGHTHSVHSVAFSPDSKHLVSSGADHAIRVWKIQGDPPGSPSAVCIPPTWFVDEDGWAVDEHGHLLFWVMPDLRGSLLMPRNTVLISRHGSVSINFEDAKIGESWIECYTPA